MAIVSDVEIRLRADIARLQQDMNRARASVDGAMRNIAQSAERARNALLALGAGVGAGGLVRMVDEYTKVTAQLRLASESQREYAAAMAEVKRISTSSQQDLQSVGVLYARIAQSTRELGISQKQVTQITEAVSASLVISGATADEAASAQLQLSQAFAAGALRGEEFNAVNEAAPRLMLALADGIGVPVGALKKMAEEGQITSDIMARVLPQALGKLREEAKQISTIAGAFTVLKNRVTEFVGVGAESSGAVTVITRAMGMLADNLQLVAGALMTVAAVKLVTWLEATTTRTIAAVQQNRALAASNLANAQASATATAQASLLANARLAEVRAATLAATGNVQLALTTNALIPAQTRAKLAADAHSVAMLGLAAAQRAASASTMAMSTVLTALGGPLGAVIAVLGIAATAWSIYKQRQAEANAAAAADTKASTAEMIASLEKGNAKLRERIRLQAEANSTPSLMEEGPEAERLAETLTEINQLKAKGAQLDGGDQVRLITLQGIANELDREIKERVRLKAHQDANGQAAKDLVAVRERLNGVNGQYLKDLAALQAGLEKGAITQAEYVRLVSKLAKETYSASEAGKAAAEASKAGVSAAKESARAAEQNAEAYAELVLRMRERADETRREADGMEPLNEAQRLNAELTKQLASGKLKLKAAQEQVLRAGYAEIQQNLDNAQALKTHQAHIEDLRKEYEKVQETRAAEVKTAQGELDRQKELVETFGMTESAIAKLTVARLQDQLARAADDNLTKEEIDHLKQVIALKEEAADVLADREELERVRDFWTGIDKTAKDTFVSILDGGKDLGKRLRDTLKSTFFDWLYQQTVRKWIINIGTAVSGSSAVSGIANAAGGGGGGGGGATGGFMNTMGNALGVTGTMSTIGSFAATGFMNTVAGTGLGSGLTAAGSMMANGSVASGIGMGVGAIAPYALAAMAVYALWKKLDTSGTYHTGGAASASAAGTSTVRAESLNFQATRVDAQVNSMTAQLAQSVVGILDATALTFGKTAGFTAATAFADDTSKDGAWGGLVISKLGEKILDWQDTRTSRWAPKEFDDGAKGRDQYLQAIAVSTRQALESIGLPAWAKGMLDQVGEGATIEQLAQVVDQINATQGALKILGDNIAGFAAMSDGAVSALIKAAGGVQNLAAGAAAFYDGFYTEAEKTERATKQLSDALASAGLQMPATREAYRELVEAQMKLGEAGAPAVAALLANAQAFAQLHPIVEQVADAVEDAATDTGDALARLRREQELRIQIMELEGNTAGAVALQRKIELEELDASLRPLQERIYALQDERDAIDRVREGMEANRDFLNGLVDTALAGVERAVQAQKDRVTTAYQEAMRELETSIGRVNETIQRTGDLSKALRNARLTSETASGGARAAVGRAEISAALAIAKASGILPTAESLADALDAVGMTSTDDYANAVEYQRAVARTNNELDALGVLTDKQLSEAEKQLLALQDQKTAAEAAHVAELARLDSIVEFARNQVDMLRGISANAQSIDAALGDLSRAMVALASAPEPSTATPGGAVGGRIRTVEDLYTEILGRAPDADGLAFWKKAFGDSVDQAEYLDFMKGAQPELQGIIKPPVVQSSGQGTMGNSSAMLAELQTLNTRMATVEVAMNNTAAATGQFAQQFHQVSAGGNALATEII